MIAVVVFVAVLIAAGVGIEMYERRAEARAVAARRRLLDELRGKP